MTPEEEAAARDKTVHNERVKLSASTVNTIGLTLIGAALIGPVSPVVYVISGNHSLTIGQVTAGAVSLAITGAMLHIVARHYLKGMR